MRLIDPARLSLDDEHPVLSDATRAVIELLVGVREALLRAAGGAVWLQHYEFADRAGHADHLNSALDDAERARYASAFATPLPG